MESRNESYTGRLRIDVDFGCSTFDGLPIEECIANWIRQMPEQLDASHVIKWDDAIITVTVARLMED